MPADHEPVSPREVSEFVTEVLRLSRSGLPDDPAGRVAFFERKADLLTRIADHDGDDETHAVARAACEQLAQIRAEQDGRPPQSAQDRPRAGGT